MAASSLKQDRERFTQGASAPFTTLAATAGAALAIPLTQLVQRPAQRGQLPGAMTSAGLDSHGPFYGIVLLIALPFLGAALARRFASRPSSGTLASTLLLVVVIAALAAAGGRPALLLFALSAIAIAIYLFLNKGSLSRRELLILPLFLSLFLLLLDTTSLAPAATAFLSFLLVLLARFGAGVAARRRALPPVEPPLLFVLSPLALLFQLHPGPQTRAAVFVSAAILIGAPVLMLALPRLYSARRLLAIVVLPIAAFAYPIALTGMDAPPKVDFFEDGHSLLPASELLRGEKPYRDIIPGHGLLSDGGIDALVLSTGGSDAGHVLRARRWLAALNPVAVYAVVFCATGSPELGFAAVFLAICLFPASTFWLRGVPALLALALGCRALITRDVRKLPFAGALLVIAYLISIDLAVYSTIALAIVCITISRHLLSRLRAMKALLAGMTVVMLPLLAWLASNGILIAFFRVTITEVLLLGPVYTPGRLSLPESVHLAGVNEVLSSLRNPELVACLLWIVAVIAAASIVVRSSRSRRMNVITVIGVWIAAAGLSYAERRHLYFIFALAPFLVMAVASMRQRRTILLAAVALVLASGPLSHLLELAAPLRRSGGFTNAGMIPLPGVPRARGVVFEPGQVQPLQTTAAYLARLPRGQTFFDFTDSAILFFLFDRNDPIRQYEVPYFEKARRQREVIARLESDRSVRAALIAYPEWSMAIDGVPNSVRAPLVWNYLQKNFEPDFNRDGVVFWRRKK